MFKTLLFKIFKNPKVPLVKTKRLAVSAESAEFQPSTTADRSRVLMRIGKTTLLVLKCFNFLWLFKSERQF